MQTKVVLHYALHTSSLRAKASLVKVGYMHTFSETAEPDVVLPSEVHGKT
jgi:hypothetical protein